MVSCFKELFDLSSWPITKNGWPIDPLFGVMFSEVTTPAAFVWNYVIDVPVDISMAKVQVLLMSLNL